MVGGGGEPTAGLETFDNASGYDHTWVESAGDADEDCTTSPCPLTGTGQSLKLAFGDKSELAVSDTYTLNVSFLFHATTLPTSSFLYTVHFYNDTTEVAYAAITSSGKIYIRHGTAYDDGGAFSANITYRVWIDITIGNAGSGTIRAYYAHYTGAETKPSASAVVTTGTSILPINKIVLQRVGFSDSGYTYIDNFDIR